MVNLGEEPKLTGLDFTIIDPKHRQFDRIDVHANAWGGDPYNTAHMQVTKRGIYDFTGDYRNIAYFNALPSYANPLAPLGFNERAFDIRRRTGEYDLRLFPGKHVMPYLVYEWLAAGATVHGERETWVQDTVNEYAVPVSLRDSTNNYRGGVHLEFNHWHVTVEQGGTTFKDDSEATANGVSYGDRTTPALGSTMVLNTLQENYGVRGTSLYTKILGTANPTSWMNLYGQYLHSGLQSNARYFDQATGNFALLSSLLIYSGQYDLSSSAANAPHTLANAGIEVRPARRLRIISSYSTNCCNSTRRMGPSRNRFC